MGGFPARNNTWIHLNVTLFTSSPKRWLLKARIDERSLNLSFGYRGLEYQHCPDGQSAHISQEAKAFCALPYLHGIFSPL